MPDSTTIDLAPLRTACKGEVSSPGDDGFDAARQAFNLMIDQRPAAIATPADADDVVEIIGFAREHGRRVAAQRTGHNAGPLGSLADTLLLKTQGLGGAELDREARSARVGGGAKWQDLVPQASEAGLAPLHGAAPGVGITGYTLGGGVGWYGRKHGLASDSVTAIELVSADGRKVRTDRDNEPDLFWALRGGGGNFGVVTALEFGLYEISEVYAGILFFPFERAPEILHAWREWLPGVPEEVSSIGRLLQFPPMEEVPEPVRGRSFAVVEAACLLSEEDASELLMPLRELGPEMDTFAVVPPVGLGELHMDPPMPAPALSAHELLGDPSAQVVDDLLAAAGPGSGSPLLSVELRHTGGALARSQPDSGVLGSVPGSLLAFGVTATPDEEAAARARDGLANLSAALAPHAVGRLLNFTEEVYDLDNVFGEQSYKRLRAVKAQYDPDGVIHANHAVSG